MRKAAATLFILFFVFSASAFSSSLNAVDRTAGTESPAHFTVEANNDQATAQKFEITSINRPPATIGWFQYDSSETVEPGENATLDIKIYPERYSVQQNYLFDVNLKNSKGDRQKLSSYFTVDTGSDLTVYSADVNGTSFEPGQDVRADIVIANTAASAVSNYSLEAHTLREQKFMEGELIPSGSRKSYTFRFEVPETEEPGQKQLKFVLNQETTTEINRTYQVNEVSSITRTRETTDRLLSNSETSTVENTGNRAVNVTINHTSKSYLAPLTSFSEEPGETASNEVGKLYTWNKTLQVGEQVSIQRTTSFWPPVLLIAFISAVIVAIDKLYSGLKASKTAKLADDGIKVRIELLNRSRNDIRHLEVEDFVPDIATVDREFDVAKPRVSKTGEGTRLNWDIGTMNPGEQRVLEYTIKPSVKVEGGAILPPAKVKIDDRDLTSTREATTEFDPENH